MRPTLRQLEYAVAVAEARHFGRAAQRCAVTQPGLSAQIQELEAQLGVRLFERSRRGVLVTPVGERVVERAHRVLREADELVDAAAAGRRPLAGALRLGVIPTVAPYLLPPVLPEVRRAHPELRLGLREETTDALVLRLREGTLDLLLLALPLEEPDLEELPLLEEPFRLVAPREHPLAAEEGPVAESALAAEEVLLLEDGHCLRAQALDVCRRVGASEAGNLQATSLGTLVQMVANGLGVTLLPALAVPVELRGIEGMATRPFRRPEPGRTLGLAWRRGSARAEEFRRLGTLLVEGARRLPGAAPRTAPAEEGEGAPAREAPG